MTDVLKEGYLTQITPWLPNSGIAKYDTDPIPATVGYPECIRMSLLYSNAPYVASVVGGLNTITVNWGAPVALTAGGALPASWIITNILGAAVTVISITQTDPLTTTLITSDQTTGNAYSIRVDAGVVYNTGTLLANAVWTGNFIGNGAMPSLVSAVPQGPNTILCTFSEAVVTIEASTSTNYNIDHGLIVDYVVAASSTQYMLHTADMGPGIIYTVTVSNIHDLVGNIVT